MAEATFDVGLGLNGNHVMVTGSSGAIGTVVVRAFLAAGAYVSALDIVQPRASLNHERLRVEQVDITDEAALERAMESARAVFGMINSCIMAAGLDLSYCQHHSVVDMRKSLRKPVPVLPEPSFLCLSWYILSKLTTKQL